MICVINSNMLHSSWGGPGYVLEETQYTRLWASKINGWVLFALLKESHCQLTYAIMPSLSEKDFIEFKARRTIRPSHLTSYLSEAITFHQNTPVLSMTPLVKIKHLSSQKTNTAL